MSNGAETELLGDFTLKHMDLRTSRGERWKAVAFDFSSRDVEAVFLIVRQDDV